MHAWATLLLASPRGAPIRILALRLVVGIAGALLLLPALVTPLVWASGGGWMHPALVTSVPLLAMAGGGALAHAWRPGARGRAALVTGAAVAALGARVWGWLAGVDADWTTLGAMTGSVVGGSLLLAREAA